MRLHHLFAAFFFAAVFPTLTFLAPAKAALHHHHGAHTHAGCLPSSVKRVLATIRKKFGPIRIVSTHRPGARIAGSGRRSYHATCRAVDFHPPRGKNKAVAKWLKANHKGGVGTYSCGMHHIHIDNGPKVRFHKCQGSGRGYAKRKRAKRPYRARRASRSYNRAYRNRSYGSRPRYRRRGYAYY